MPFLYSAYGVTLSSELPLPELPPASGPAEVWLRVGAVEAPPPLPEEPFLSWRCEADETCLAWKGLGAFRVTDGREIVADPAPGVEAGLLRDFLLSRVLGALLQQRGYLVLLHASAVEINGQAVAFVGKSGEGKSTLTAALHTRGYPVVSDELVPVDFSGGALRTWPAFSRLKLSAEAAAAVGAPEGALTELFAAEEKRGWQVAPAQPGVSLPLTRIYLLRSGDELSVRVASSVEAVGELVRQTFNKRLLAPDRLRAHFLACAGLVRSGQVRFLTRRRNLAELDQVARLVETDLRPE